MLDVPHNRPTGRIARDEARRLQERLLASRRLSLDLSAPLTDEDQVVQASPDASPTKWHLGHTTWFYEAFVLGPRLSGYEAYDPAFAYCFNSYYESMGARHPRASRGLLTRPSADAVRHWRGHVDAALARLCDGLPDMASGAELTALLELGINHEQQHQELLLTDVLCLFAAEPLRPAYKPENGPRPSGTKGAGSAHRWVAFDGGDADVGFSGAGFCYDHEAPRHRVALAPYRLADRLVTNGDWLAFMADGGYRNPLLWLADGWATVTANGWTAPGYWEERDGGWCQMTLRGLLPIDPHTPVSHISYFEADAFARWSGARLPTEQEWEVAAADAPLVGNMLGRGALRPEPATGRRDLDQLYGDVWEWTSSAFSPYPGYRPAPGAIGEYNGKFMVSQQVLRGASCVTPDGHSRPTYRNFFYPHQRWQFTGLRLASDA